MSELQGRKPGSPMAVKIDIKVQERGGDGAGVGGNGKAVSLLLTLVNMVCISEIL